MTPWTALENTELWMAARHGYALNNHAYHNFDHVTRMYAHAEALNFEYDIHLDRAILAHDVLDDELTSARWLDGALGHADPIAGALIATTVHHTPGSGDDRLILLDLADFRNDDVRRHNTALLEREALLSRGIAALQFRKGTIGYLEGLSDRIEEGLAQVTDAGHLDLWREVRSGIGATLIELGSMEPDAGPFFTVG